ncbi:MAG TPA: efflux RND transporter periplasmic adaptor subunit [Longimicrobiales bacterium]|jgi:cobalt-zinc-cadmium efflux system membrane fusion protein|nr:efflux RND transporter periplasmic adaptor subunit [Longimicrobiales bacterium]
MNRMTLHYKPARAVLVAMSTLTMSCHPAEPDSSSGEGAELELSDRVALTADALASLELTYATAELMELSPTVDVPAELVPDPDRHAEIGARVAGRIVDVFVNDGDHVGLRDPLLAIESPEMGEAWADFVGARARERVARRARDRLAQLLEGRVTSIRSFEEAEGAWEIADAEFSAARTRLAALGVTDPSEPPENPARVLLRSPIEGTVTARMASRGAWVDPADVLLRVIDLDEVWLEASVYEQKMRYVDVGQDVQVEVRALPGEVFLGSVERIDGVLDEDTRSIGVSVSLANEDGRLRPGMFGTARIRGSYAEEVRSLVVIPAAAVQELDGGPAVFVRVDEGVFEVRTVHTGRRSGALVEVITGLDVGEEVVADGSLLLKGQLLRSELAEEDEG